MPDQSTIYSVLNIATYARSFFNLTRKETKGVQGDRWQIQEKKEWLG